MVTKLNLPKPAITHQLINDIAEGLFAVLGAEAVVGIYLGGSIATGGFSDQTSDLDFLIILKDLPDGTMLTALGDMHARVRGLNTTRLHSNYEADYLAAGQAQNPLAPNIAAPHLGTDGHFAVEPHGAELVIDLWNIRRAGLTVYGPEPAGVVGDITTDDMLAAIATIFTSWWLPKLQKQEPMDDEYQAYAVLTMARILYGLQMRGEVSKQQAADWLMAEHPEYVQLLRGALAWRSGARLDSQKQVYDLIRFIARQIETRGI